MPPWTSRILPSTSASSSSHSNQVHAPPPPSHRNAVEPDRTALIAIDYNVPILSPTTPTAPAFSSPSSRNRRRPHARSISQPFPSLMDASALRKTDKKAAAVNRDLDADFSDTEPSGSNKVRSPGEDLPRPASTKGGYQHDDVDSEAHPPPPPPKDGSPERSLPVPISIEETRNIIDGCLSRYLQRCLSGNQDSEPARPDQKIRETSHRRQEPQTDEKQAAPSNIPFTLSSTNFLSPPSSGAEDMARRDGRSMRFRSSSDTPPLSRRRGHSAQGERDRSPLRLNTKATEPKTRPSMFRPLEEYIIRSFTGCDCLNVSFMTASALRTITTAPEDDRPKQQVLSPTSPTSENVLFPEIDPKMLLLGDLAENSSWWMGGRPRRHESKEPKDSAPRRDKSPLRPKSIVTTRSPRIEWGAVAEWYHLVLHAGENWRETWKNLKQKTSIDGQIESGVSVDLNLIEKEIAEARVHAQKTLFKATENLLKRPRRPLQRPELTRFLLILLANPELNPLSGSTPVAPNLPPLESVADSQKPVPNFSRPHGAGEKKVSTRSQSSSLGHHSGIVKRILGLLGNLPNECHHYLVGWFARLSKSQFETFVGLIGRFITYRLSKQHHHHHHHGRHRSGSVQPVNGLVPSFPGGIESSPAHLHAVLHDSRPPGQSNEGSSHSRRMMYNTDDWQIRAAARVMALLFAANNQAKTSTSKRDALLPKDYNAATAPLISQYKRSSMTLPLHYFYNTLLDYSDLVSDFEAWEARTAKFSFCQYPFFLSIAAKSRILEHDARRQMSIKAREAFLDSILNRKDVSQYLNLKVRRDCLIEDSLRGVSEVVGAGSEDIKKSLRIEFIGEEGVDAGGLRKEWFLLLVREVFDPNHGLFVYDEDSQYCYFNPFCFESSEQFFLVGVLLGLAIYNSTILDIALPPFAFKKLLAAAPATSIPAAAQKPPHVSSLDDLSEYRPALAKGLRALLDFDGHVQETFCYDFVAQVDRYGQNVKVPLCPNGEKKPVTNTNRHEFVSLYVQYLLDTAVQRQFEPFKRGFYTVCGGNALALFRPEEIELMVRGSDEPLDVPTLRAVATYENWPAPKAADLQVHATTQPSSSSTSKEPPTTDPPSEPVITWFWDFFTRSSPSNQRKLLSFVTGSDRIPATGAASLSIRLSCLGEDCERYPIAHTCFNKLGLFRYASKQKLERKLWDAICNSEGFGLK
ncbi:hypothetical protein UA08_05358 [Talaromyces atroroseus]|uniref:HECT-type E3 ubiquitin transferase n=1 Tax=Talaromyces atroroseus TaxID=1441469 RepID=A0A225AMI6_TALAT|nr:hypothetical protein UA08_05358 [Talaromyces atroroseus]OKL59544.1 hypothetical protein UA08_05358 [Talaromyces atroroseus]